MEQVEQLKAMRDAAKARIEALPDYRLMTSLTTLIAELEEAFGMAPAGETAGEETGEEASASEAEEGLASIPQAEPADPAMIEPAMIEPGMIEPAMIEPESVAETAAEPEAEEATPAMQEPEEAMEAALMSAVDDEIGEIDFSSLEADITGDGLEVGEAQSGTVAEGANNAEEDEDEAIRRAMEELEADLESVKL